MQCQQRLPFLDPTAHSPATPLDTQVATVEDASPGWGVRHQDRGLLCLRYPRQVLLDAWQPVQIVLWRLDPSPSRIV